jgi:hypothetical protein
MEPAHMIQSEAFEGLSARTLFYPSAGRDWATPIEAFRPWVRDFWFVDQNYPFPGLRLPATKLEHEWTEEVTGETLRAKTPFVISIRHREYRARDGEVYRTHECHGRGFDVFRAVIRARGIPLGVFFHRGDSLGNGGSNFWWLHRKRLESVLQLLEPGGLIVSDGSLALRNFKWSAPEGWAGDLSAIRSFKRRSHRFDCVGYLGERYGPTLVWKTTSLVEPHLGRSHVAETDG